MDPIFGYFDEEEETRHIYVLDAYTIKGAHVSHKQYKYYNENNDGNTLHTEDGRTFEIR